MTNKWISILFGDHKASTISGFVLAALYSLIGGEQNVVTDPKVLIISAVIALGGRFLGELPGAATDVQTLDAYVAEASNATTVGVIADLAKRNAELTAQLSGNEAARKEVIRETQDMARNAHSGADADILRRDL